MLVLLLSLLRAIMSIYPNIFVLCTGRCGSTTFVRAAKYLENYSSGHETRTHCVGWERFAYPVRHIEADNRLSWFLGRLDARYGDSAYYVHLQRDLLDTARSFAKRANSGILRSYRSSILMGASNDLNADSDFLPLCIDYCLNVQANIDLFLRGKSHKMVFHLEAAEADWVRFWNSIDAVGDLDGSLKEWKIKHNRSRD